MPFGAFVNILPGKDGMVHVSDMTEGYVNDANDVVKIGDKVQVRVKEIDDMGRINLSMRMDPSTDKPKEERRPSTGGDRRSGGGFRGGGRPSGGFSRGSGSGRSFGGDRDRRPSTGGDDRRSSGPHFPTTRYFQTDRNDR